MITINLTPESIKQEMRLKQLYQLNKRLLFVIIFACFVVTALSMVARFSLGGTFEMLISQIDLIDSNVKSHNVRIHEINEKVKAIDQIQLGSTNWAALAQDFSELIPENVRLTYSRIDQTNSTIHIKGEALTREGLFKLRDNLITSGVFKSVDFPTSSILSKENIPFEISSKFDQNALLK